jgi:hypothetical protein
VDSDGFYCSSERCDPCIVTGIFFEEPVLDTSETMQDLERVFGNLLEASQTCGYQVFREALGLTED